MTKQIRPRSGPDPQHGGDGSGGDSPDLAVAYVVWAIEHPVVPDAQPGAQLRRQRRRPPAAGPGLCFDLLMDSMRAGQESGYFADNDPQDLALAAWAACTAWPRCSSTAD